MNIRQAGLDLIKRFEALRLKAYLPLADDEKGTTIAGMVRRRNEESKLFGIK